MIAAALECPDCEAGNHVRPCVKSLACWWKEVRELEVLLGYERSSIRAQEMWDELIASEVPAPQPALYIELRCVVQVWKRITASRRLVCPTLLDRFICVASSEHLSLPSHALLTAFRLHQILVGTEAGEV